MKRLGLLLLIIGISVSGWCQKSEFFSDFGIIGGAGGSHALGWSTWEPTLGFMLGVEINVYDISENSLIRTGVVFTKQGGPNTESGSNNYYQPTMKGTQLYEMEPSHKVSLYYINIPVLYQYKSNGGLYLEGGIQPGILVSAKEKVDGGNSTDVKTWFKALDFGIPVGAGYWINDRLSFGVSAVFGLININSANATEQKVDTTNRNLLLLGVVRFNFL